MKYTIPHFYKEFRCIADKCPDTCCAGWQIVIDPQSLNKYRKVKGGFRNRLLNAIDWKEHTFHQCEGRCEFLNEENLCDLYTELGPAGFCQTCRRYPRHIEEFENLREISLSLSCPEAARLLLECREQIRFISAERKMKEETYEDFDFLLFEKLMEVREAIFGILQNRVVSISDRMILVTTLGHDFQRRICQNQLFSTEELLKRYQKEGAADRFRKLWDQKNHASADCCETGSATENNPKRDWFEARKQLMACISRMEPLKEEWVRYRNQMQHTLYRQGFAVYQEQEKAFQRQIKAEGLSEMAEIWTEQLLVYFVFTYFCGAVYDGDAFSKLKLALHSVFVIWEQVKFEWLNGQKVCEELMIKAAVRYAREAEHSDVNLNLLDRIFRTELTGEMFLKAGC